MSEPFAKPLWLKVQDGDPLTRAERRKIWWGRIRHYLRERRNTAALRERCVQYAIQSGSNGYSVEHEAERLRDFIIGRT